MNPSTSTSSLSSLGASSGTNTPDMGKCQICFQAAHGKHFGVDSCRACAAFFRRVFVTHKQHFKCRDGNKKCLPDSYGRWNCKRCRTDRCFALGMKPDNIQYNRDHFFCSEDFLTRKCNRISRSPPLPEHTSFIDISPLLETLQKMLSDRSLKDYDRKCLNPLQKLAYGLREVRKTQIWDDLPITECIGKNESFIFWKSEVERACTWLSYFDEFQKLSIEDKTHISKCMWIIFTRLERSAMTAELRRANKCGSSDYAFTTYSVINTKTLKWDFNWLTHFPSDQMQNFLGTTQMILCEPLTNCMAEVQPTEEELCYILCDLCFYFLGSKLGGAMQETMERFQGILADNLHQYYVEHDKTSRYSHRLGQILKISQQYKSIMEEKRKIRILGEIFNAFRVQWSHNDLFIYERFD
ncbi:hypothetical protein GCK72_017270 [Caenorhabditis remanei]|uniref:Uncharacterized protein n=1 Tax=Caenorhabditis remanei TaxID=31234 RepID=A0A6A5G897_CAERE|nr:hypothetical protein GCK72_017270 [Caenorhabditis remanei]KAF1750719.1 hypothetical protein GCK72_017270 [Caenorhabditis remanei]